VFSLKEIDNETQIKHLLSFDLDVGFVRLERVPKDLETKPILNENFCLVLPKSFKISSKSLKNLESFKNESFILFDPKYSASYYEKVMQIFDDSGFLPIISHNTIHAGSIYKLVENGFGISIVPKSLAANNNENLQFIELDKMKQKTTLSVVWNKNNRNPMLQNFLKLI
ncbi:LysR substrate-binding domain-containing protein, partial [Seonamhaeicola marinus]